ncbi:MAG TPA: HEAT repeat domain-containing protein [Acidimicrobiales bacterium]|nr:HEAT repeat domain-containing protein [Acidimicrobiales bacterium]
MQELDDLRSPDRLVRLAAAAALDDLPQTLEIEQALLDACRDDDAKVRRAAMHSLTCAHCKPDRCVAPEHTDVIVDALLGDPSIRNRRWAAGVTMFGQLGQPARLTEAFRTVLDTSGDRVLRERAASYLAYLEHPRFEGAAHRDWFPAWQRRVEELLAAA